MDTEHWIVSSNGKRVRRTIMQELLREDPYEHYLPLNLSFLSEPLCVGRLAELECLNDGDTEIAFADRLGQSGEHSRIRLYAEGLDANIFSFCRSGFSQNRTQDPPWLQLRNQLPNDLSIHGVGDCIQIR